MAPFPKPSKGKEDKPKPFKPQHVEPDTGYTVYNKLNRAFDSEQAECMVTIIPDEPVEPYDLSSNPDHDTIKQSHAVFKEKKLVTKLIAISDSKLTQDKKIAEHAKLIDQHFDRVIFGKDIGKSDISKNIDTKKLLQDGKISAWKYVSKSPDDSNKELKFKAANTKLEQAVNTAKRFHSTNTTETVAYIPADVQGKKVQIKDKGKIYKLDVPDLDKLHPAQARDLIEFDKIFPYRTGVVIPVSHAGRDCCLNAAVATMRRMFPNKPVPTKEDVMKNLPNFCKQTSNFTPDAVAAGIREWALFLDEPWDLRMGYVEEGKFSAGKFVRFLSYDDEGSEEYNSATRFVIWNDGSYDYSGRFNIKNLEQEGSSDGGYKTSLYGGLVPVEVELSDQAPEVKPEEASVPVDKPEPAEALPNIDVVRLGTIRSFVKPKFEANLADLEQEIEAAAQIEDQAADSGTQPKPTPKIKCSFVAKSEPIMNSSFGINIQIEYRDAVRGNLCSTWSSIKLNVKNIVDEPTCKRITEADIPQLQQLFPHVSLPVFKAMTLQQTPPVHYTFHTNENVQGAALHALHNYGNECSDLLYKTSAALRSSCKVHILAHHGEEAEQRFKRIAEDLAWYKSHGPNAYFRHYVIRRPNTKYDFICQMGKLFKAPLARPMVYGKYGEQKFTKEGEPVLPRFPAELSFETLTDYLLHNLLSATYNGEFLEAQKVEEYLTQVRVLDLGTTLGSEDKDLGLGTRRTIALVQQVVGGPNFGQGDNLLISFDVPDDLDEPGWADDDSYHHAVVSPNLPYSSLADFTVIVSAKLLKNKTDNTEEWASIEPKFKSTPIWDWKDAETASKAIDDCQPVNAYIKVPHSLLHWKHAMNAVRDIIEHQAGGGGQIDMLHTLTGNCTLTFDTGRSMYEHVDMRWLQLALAAFKLNEGQSEFVYQMCDMFCRFLVLAGPGGTGKTHTIITSWIPFFLEAAFKGTYARTHFWSPVNANASALALEADNKGQICYSLGFAARPALVVRSNNPKIDRKVGERDAELQGQIRRRERTSRFQTKDGKPWSLKNIIKLKEYYQGKLGHDAAPATESTPINTEQTEQELRKLKTKMQTLSNWSAALEEAAPDGGWGDTESLPPDPSTSWDVSEDLKSSDAGVCVYCSLQLPKSKHKCRGANTFTPSEIENLADLAHGAKDWDAQTQPIETDFDLSFDTLRSNAIAGKPRSIGTLIFFADAFIRNLKIRLKKDAEAASLQYSKLQVTTYAPPTVTDDDQTEVPSSTTKLESEIPESTEVPPALRSDLPEDPIDAFQELRLTQLLAETLLVRKTVIGAYADKLFRDFSIDDERHVLLRFSPGRRMLQAAGILPVDAGYEFFVVKDRFVKFRSMYTDKASGTVWDDAQKEEWAETMWQVYEYVMSHADAIVSTIFTAGVSRFTKSCHEYLDEVPMNPVHYMDEAGKLDEADFLSIISYFGGQAEFFVFVGDVHQCAPLQLVSNPCEKQGKLLLIQRLELLNVPSIHLYEQRRFPDDINDAVSTLVYKGRLVCHESVNKRKEVLAAKNFVEQNKLYGGIFHGYPAFEPSNLVLVNLSGGDEESVVNSYYNLFSARAVYFILRGILTDQDLMKVIPAHQIGVLCPYRSQLAILNKTIQALAEHYPDLRQPIYNIAHSTFDAYIGMELEIIIVDVTRTKSLGFLCYDNRVNLGITRGRSLVILVGNFRKLSTHKSYSGTLLQDFVNWAKSHNQVVHLNENRLPVLRELDPANISARLEGLRENKEVLEEISAPGKDIASSGRSFVLTHWPEKRFELHYVNEPLPYRPLPVEEVTQTWQDGTAHDWYEAEDEDWVQTHYFGHYSDGDSGQPGRIDLVDPADWYCTRENADCKDDQQWQAYKRADGIMYLIHRPSGISDESIVTAIQVLDVTEPDYVFKIPLIGDEHEFHDFRNISHLNPTIPLEDGYEEIYMPQYRNKENKWDLWYSPELEAIKSASNISTSYDSFYSMPQVEGTSWEVIPNILQSMPDVPTATFIMAISPDESEVVIKNVYAQSEQATKDYWHSVLPSRIRETVRARMMARAEIAWPLEWSFSLSANGDQTTSRPSWKDMIADPDTVTVGLPEFPELQQDENEPQADTGGEISVLNTGDNTVGDFGNGDFGGGDTQDTGFTPDTGKDSNVYTGGW